VSKAIYQTNVDRHYLRNKSKDEIIEILMLFVKGHNEKEFALRNIKALAKKIKALAKKINSTQLNDIPAWDQVIQWCNAAGLTDSYLRETGQGDEPQGVSWKEATS